MIRISFTTSLLLIFLALFANGRSADAANSQSRIRRMVLVVGANDGGDNRTLLRYAGTDASRIAKLTKELGGVASRDIIQIDDSKLASLKAALDTIEGRLKSAKAPGTRLEFLFYYSGHSDETGLLLGGSRYPYSTLRQRVESMPAEVKIAILDSCASGAFTRTKGGTRRPAFLVDESSRVNGYALIASSSATELAQESDRIASSFFTHYFVSGLRGGADANRDGRVTLNEAYQYAFDETVSRTESTQAGAQHPAYNMHLAGTGDVVMTDLRSTNASLIVDKDIVGRLFIRDSSGNLVVELTKRQHHPITLGLAADNYSVVLLVEGVLARAKVALSTGRPSTLRASHFTRFRGEQFVTRGGAVEKDKRPVETQYFGASILPSISTGGSRVRRNISFNLLGGSISELEGVEIGALVNNVTDEVRGLQLAGIVNASQGPVTGVQAAGIANLSTGAVKGVQIGGIANTAVGTLTGIQAAGVANINTGSMRAIQMAGVANHNQGRAIGVQMSGVANYAGTLQGLQIGGVANYTNDASEAFQVAGVANRSSTIYGAQIAGVANVARDVKGFQIAGVANVAQSVRGLQVSPLNIAAGKVEGLQIGVINVAKESDFSIGILSFVENGYHALEAWTSDTSTVAVGLKMGAKRTYTLISAAQTLSNNPTIGLGFGIHTPLQEFFVDVDATAFSRADAWNDVEDDENDLLAKLRFTLGWQLNANLSLIGGISLNTSHAFSKEGEERGVVHKEYRTDDYVLRYGPGAFLGASWNLGGN